MEGVEIWLVVMVGVGMGKIENIKEKKWREIVEKAPPRGIGQI